MIQGTHGLVNADAKESDVTLEALAALRDHPTELAPALAAIHAAAAPLERAC